MDNVQQSELTTANQNSQLPFRTFSSQSKDRATTQITQKPIKMHNSQSELNTSKSEHIRDNHNSQDKVKNTRANQNSKLITANQNSQLPIKTHDSCCVKNTRANQNSQQKIQYTTAN